MNNKLPRNQLATSLLFLCECEYFSSMLLVPGVYAAPKTAVSVDKEMVARAVSTLLGTCGAASAYLSIRQSNDVFKEV